MRIGLHRCFDCNDGRRVGLGDLPNLPSSPARGRLQRGASDEAERAERRSLDAGKAHDRSPCDRPFV